MRVSYFQFVYNGFFLLRDHRFLKKLSKFLIVAAFALFAKRSGGPVFNKCCYVLSDKRYFCGLKIWCFSYVLNNWGSTFYSHFLKCHFSHLLSIYFFFQFFWFCLVFTV